MEGNWAFIINNATGCYTICIYVVRCHVLYEEIIYVDYEFHFNIMKSHLEFFKNVFKELKKTFVFIYQLWEIFNLVQWEKLIEIENCLGELIFSIDFS